MDVATETTAKIVGCIRTNKSLSKTDGDETAINNIMHITTPININESRFNLPAALGSSILFVRLRIIEIAMLITLVIKHKNAMITDVP
jgi:hypothetical protein